jgi:hypothetical protein
VLHKGSVLKHEGRVLYERIVREELGQGHFRSVHELILFCVQAWREHNLPQAQCRANGWDKSAEFVAWAKSLPIHRRCPMKQ